MIVVGSNNGVPVRLTEERWRHLIEQHPEMDGQRERVLETLTEPNAVQEGDLGELLAIRRYTDTPLGEKFVVVVYRETSPEDGFVVTAYLTRRPSSRRETVWKR